ncbi:hypothetical protein [Methanolobus halotolerans]|uniref:Uncharacterized protein n=1 Tax=Methanolobus halotolerans TaxID=2052935 RepID=A0A4E0PXG6_9EURY|nr:hypothetical protein [Methanolobus halotolerans]TGC09442.1 hypothetical protein CUN85_06330 [Methanolobus halotolerans]
MLNFDGNFHEIDLTTYILIYMLLAIAVNLIQFLSKTMLLDWQSKKKRSDLIKAFRINKRIKPHIDEYEKIKWFNIDFKGYVYSNIGLLCGFIVPSCIVILVLYLYETTYQIELSDILALNLMTYTIIISFLVSLISFILMGHIVKKAFNNSLLLKKHVTYASILRAITYYTLGICLLNFSFMLFLLYNWRTMIYSSSFTQLLVIIAFSMVAGVIFLSFIAKKSYEKTVKNFINVDKVSTFPFMNIFTNENTQICGTVLDIFDDKILTLKDGYMERIISWNSVHIIEIDNKIREEHEDQTHLDSFYQPSSNLHGLPSRNDSAGYN